MITADKAENIEKKYIIVHKCESSINIRVYSSDADKACDFIRSLGLTPTCGAVKNSRVLINIS